MLILGGGTGRVKRASGPDGQAASHAVSIGALFEVEGFTQADDEAVVAGVGEEPPEGCLIHVAGPTESGWRVIEVWGQRMRSGGSRRVG